MRVPMMDVDMCYIYSHNLLYHTLDQSEPSTMIFVRALRHLMSLLPLNKHGWYVVRLLPIVVMCSASVYVSKRMTV